MDLNRVSKYYRYMRKTYSKKHERKSELFAVWGKGRG